MALTDKLFAIGEAIREMTGDTERLTLDAMPDKIRGITTGGGASDDVRYVTFMSHDGAVELGRKAVAVGDDCADPIARGVFGTPTRESDVQYHYTFSGGWATVPNGGKDSNALKAVAEDRTVYANYIAAVRYYTITYYDSDGITLLESESLAYGSMPDYQPSKTGYSFDAWQPALATVMGDASYTAKWQEKVTFAGGSWEDIATICEAGEAAEYFAVGDTRTIPVTINDITYSFTAKIVGLNHDTRYDGTKAGISCIFFNALPTDKILADKVYAGDLFNGSRAHDAVQDFLNKLPTDLKGVIKSVKKQYHAAGSTSIANYNNKIWVPSVTEVCKANISTSIGGGTLVPLNEQYPYFASYSLGYNSVARYAIRTADGSETVSNYWVRNMDARTGLSAGTYSGIKVYSGTTVMTCPPNAPALPVICGFCI